MLWWHDSSWHFLTGTLCSSLSHNHVFLNKIWFKLLTNSINIFTAHIPLKYWFIAEIYWTSNLTFRSCLPHHSVSSILELSYHGWNTLWISPDRSAQVGISTFTLYFSSYFEVLVNNLFHLKISDLFNLTVGIRKLTIYCCEAFSKVSVEYSKVSMSPFQSDFMTIKSDRFKNWHIEFFPKTTP